MVRNRDFDFDDDEDYPLPSKVGARPSANNQRTHVTVNVTGQKGGFVGWHFFHLIMTILTLGLWFPIWIVHFILWLSTR